VAGVKQIRKQWWENGRLHRIWFDATDGKVTHERLIPPAHIGVLAQRLEDLRHTRKERARAAKSTGLYQIAQFTANERDELFRQGIKGGDIDGLKWALKQDQYRHARVGK